ncbi:MAG: DUF72 domain-containing protein [Proteobacteria bacterium]|nr:DUF72 domain-containing protein [Pseudomonadota bacterium]MBU1585827.1 DUF72 domain-containing protein [Pseudomonadota bacterium]MBU2455525.1 DUF72 domain-containing protein [Pseudomonadota bacterium]MBU2628550.1 DUF72 domain-containing protein [Pseudomonadota bacterium]
MTKNPSTACNLFIGTSGYSYGEWIDSGFYPDGTHSSNMLDVYMQIFQTTELNYTWYQMPKAPAIDRLCTKTPKNFKFAAKLTRTLTHEIKKGQWQKEALLYRQGIDPLIQSQKLLCILIQLPPYFERSVNFRNYLAALLDELSGLPLAVEFRHDSWVNDKVFSELERRKVTLVSVDEPDLPDLFPRLDVVTNPDLFYIRFHGRNARGWRSGNMQKQFDYDYADWELKEWANTLQTTIMPEAQAGGIFFNNHVRGQAPKNALRLIDLLIKEGGRQTPWTAQSFI